MRVDESISREPARCEENRPETLPAPGSTLTTELVANPGADQSQKCTPRLSTERSRPAVSFSEGASYVKAQTPSNGREEPVPRPAGA